MASVRVSAVEDAESAKCQVWLLSVDAEEHAAMVVPAGALSRVRYSTFPYMYHGMCRPCAAATSPVTILRFGFLFRQEWSGAPCAMFGCRLWCDF